MFQRSLVYLFLKLNLQICWFFTSPANNWCGSCCFNGKLDVFTTSGCDATFYISSQINNISIHLIKVNQISQKQNKFMFISVFSRFAALMCVFWNNWFMPIIQTFVQTASSNYMIFLLYGLLETKKTQKNVEIIHFISFSNRH